MKIKLTFPFLAMAGEENQGKYKTKLCLFTNEWTEEKGKKLKTQTNLLPL